MVEKKNPWIIKKSNNSFFTFKQLEMLKTPATVASWLFNNGNFFILFYFLFFAFNTLEI